MPSRKRAKRESPLRLMSGNVHFFKKNKAFFEKKSTLDNKKIILNINRCVWKWYNEIIKSVFAFKYIAETENVLYNKRKKEKKR